MESAFNQALYFMGDKLIATVMTNQKVNFSGKTDQTIDGQLSQAERFDRSFRNSESEASNDEFHWMANASYNLSKPAPKLLIKTTKNDK